MKHVVLEFTLILFLLCSLTSCTQTKWLETENKALKIKLEQSNSSKKVFFEKLNKKEFELDMTKDLVIIYAALACVSDSSLKIFCDTVKNERVKIIAKGCLQNRQVN